MNITDQPMPIPNDRPVVHEQVINDLRDRLTVGIERYGTPLQPFNGRDSLVDAYQEALDLAVYLRQRIEEQQRLALAIARLRDAWEVDRFKLSLSEEYSNLCFWIEKIISNAEQMGVK